MVVMVAVMVRRRTVEEGWVPRTHGAPSSYNRGCRCGPCREANTTRHRAGRYDASYRNRNYRERVLVQGVLVHPKPPGGHGKRWVYVTFGCRCGACTDAARVYIKEHRKPPKKQGVTPR